MTARDRILEAIILIVLAAAGYGFWALVLAPQARAEGTAAQIRQTNCKPRDQIVATLERKYKERRRAYGLSNKYQVLELYASQKGTWTALVTTPDGRSCIVAAGEAWTEQAATPGLPL